jgi:hypothetical protein
LRTSCRSVATLAALLAWLALPGASRAEAPTSLNGFALRPASIPAGEILPGGPPRDGIPALTRPHHLAAAEAPWHDDELVVGVVRGSEARAYPIAILNWHELVNDRLGGDDVLVSWCPLCGSALVFDREIAGKVRTFGVSGLLYKSDLLLYDRETESLWSQLEGSAVTGSSRGTRLRVLRSELTTWKSWRSRHPATRVLSLETGHGRNYARSPYAGYADSERLLFPAPLDPRYHPKTPTVGIREAGGPARGYPADELVNAGGQITDRFAGHQVRISYDPASRVFDVDASLELEVIESYWFAWAAFHPEASVFVAAPQPAPAGAERP